MNENELIGSTFAGCKIIEKIGQGGMGSVYRAEHLAMGKTVCVKILARELAFEQRNVEFFMREARSASKLDHPNIVHVYSFGEEKGLYFIVMSYVEGKSLEDILREKKKLSIPEASEFIIGILEGLAHAHSKNIIHRDIKPSNILVTKDGLPRIADFGLARSVNEEKQLTIAGEMVGTAYFMSPEQGLATKVDTRADLYAVGATFFYLITGKYPYEGKTSIEVISKHINEELPNLYQIMPDIPLWTAKVIEKLMRKKPEDRYQKAEEVLSEIKKYKENGYKDIIQNSNESTFDLEDLKKKWPSPEGNTNSNKERYAKFLVEENKSKTNIPSDKKEKEAPQIFEHKKAKFQFGIAYKITRFIYHLGLLFSAAIFSIFSGAYASPNYDASLPLFKALVSAILKNPVYSFAFLFIGMISAFLSSKTKPFKTTFLHLFFSLTMCISLYIGAILVNYPQNQDIFSRIFINISSSFTVLFSPYAGWLTAIVTLLFYAKTSKLNGILSRILSAFFLVLGFSAFIFFSHWFCAADTSSNNMLLASTVLMLLSITLSFFRKSFILLIAPSILYLSAIALVFYADFSSLTERFVQESLKNEESRYQRELEIYKLKIATLEYEVTGEYDAEGRPIINKKKLEALKPPVKKNMEQIRLEIQPKAWQAAYSRGIRYFQREGGLILLGLFLFLILNFMYWEETYFYEKNYLQV